MTLLRSHQGSSTAKEAKEASPSLCPFSASFSHVLEGLGTSQTEGKPWYYQCNVACTDMHNKSYGAMETSAKISEKTLETMYVRVNICVGSPSEGNV